MKAYLVFADWRIKGCSIYQTVLGVALSTGALHSGTTWEVEIDLPEAIAEELRRAYEDHGASAVFRVIPE